MDKSFDSINYFIDYLFRLFVQSFNLSLAAPSLAPVHMHPRQGQPDPSPSLSRAGDRHSGKDLVESEQDELADYPFICPCYYCVL